VLTNEPPHALPRYVDPAGRLWIARLQRGRTLADVDRIERREVLVVNPLPPKGTEKFVEGHTHYLRPAAILPGDEPIDLGRLFIRDDYCNLHDVTIQIFIQLFIHFS